MKKFFMIAVMAVAALTANAQKQEVGSISVMPRIGIGWAFYNDLQYKVAVLNNEVKKVDGDISACAGAEVQYQVADAFAVSAGLDYQYLKSSECKYGSGSYLEDYTTKMGYLAIPVMAHLTLGNRFAIGAGVQPALKVNASLGDSKITNAESFMFSIPVEMTYTFNGGYVLGLRYAYPVTKALTNGTTDSKVSGIFLSIGYRIDL